MDTVATEIEGYRVDVEHDGERPQCWVSYRSFSASLACLSGMGTLVDAKEREHKVPAWIIAKIEFWADLSGYNE